MQVSGLALGITCGHCDDNLLPFDFHAVGGGVADGVEAVQHKVRETIKYRADLIKICATAGGCCRSATLLRRRSTRWKSSTPSLPTLIASDVGSHGTYFVPTAYLVDWMQANANLPAFYFHKMMDVSAVAKTNARKAIAAHIMVALSTGGSDRVGALETGKWADIIAVEGDPLHDRKLLQHVWFVMKSGVVCKQED